jgi:[acyl-carrier-protein] S-malonyltransferase
MQRAVPVGEGAMVALIGAELDAARILADEAAEGQICTAANDNGGGQVVVSGHTAAVERVAAQAASKGIKRAIMLPVSAPFHCALMAPAAVEMKQALDEVRIKEPLVPLVANVSAKAVRDPSEIKRLLVEQVTGLVRWRECVLYMKDNGVDTIVEVGSGRVLSGLAKRIDRSLAGLSIGTPAEIEAFLKTL